MTFHSVYLVPNVVILLTVQNNSIRAKLDSDR